jgi:hypothetical protein
MAKFMQETYRRLHQMRQCLVLLLLLAETMLQQLKKGSVFRERKRV